MRTGAEGSSHAAIFSARWVRAGIAWMLIDAIITDGRWYVKVYGISSTSN
jgi:hypothetical protein